MIHACCTAESIRRRLIVFCALLPLSSAAVLCAQPDIPGQQSRVTVGGTARIYGDWACKANARIAATAGEAFVPLPGFPGGIQVVRVAVPISGFECSDSIVGNRFRKALKEKEHPEIHFDMYSYEFTDKEGGAKTAGDFTIAGVTKDVELDATVTPHKNRGVSVSGSIEILMTDYGIKPPEAMFGLIKVKDKVYVKFELIIPASGAGQGQIQEAPFSRQSEEFTRIR